jgi:hypothetical protein
VRSHDRSNAHVHKYERGHGKKLAEKRRVIARVVPKAPVVSFRVLVDGASYNINTTTFVSALDSGLERTTKTPSHVKITKEAK